MNYWVYILKSRKDGSLYIGKTNDIQRRLKEHNSGHTPSTRNKVPFSILETHSCKNEEEARALEKEFKKGFRREELKRKYGGVPERSNGADC